MKPAEFARIRWAIAGALLVLLMAFAASAPETCHGAEWIHMQFTAPSDSGGTIDRYRCEWKRADGVWDSSRVYRGPDPALEGVPVLPAGQTCDLYVSQTIAPLTSRTYRVIAVKTNGKRSEGGNLCVVATGFPDTLVCLSRPAAGFGRADTVIIVRPTGPVALVRGAGADLAFKRFVAPYTAWSLAYGDSADVRAIHQEELQRLYSARLCQLFGHWALRGLQTVCP